MNSLDEWALAFVGAGRLDARRPVALVEEPDRADIGQIGHGEASDLREHLGRVQRRYKLRGRLGEVTLVYLSALAVVDIDRHRHPSSDSARLVPDRHALH